jgi:hypothetical protein
MKSRIRSRWHRPNEKPLENASSSTPAAPMGEINAANPISLTDDLSNYKPSENAGRTHSKKEDRGIAGMIDAVAANLGRIIEDPAQEKNAGKIVHLAIINLLIPVNQISLIKVKTISPEENREVQEITTNHPNRDLKTQSIPKISQVDQENHIPRHLPKLR